MENPSFRRSPNCYLKPLWVTRKRNGYDVTADGRRFLMNVAVESNQDNSFTVVLKWPALLKR